MKDKLIVGLTGGIGSGKSTVGKLFREQGVTVVDADQCSRVVVEKGKPALNSIREYFGEQVIDTNGTLNRRALREIVFNNKEERIWLEALLHPLIFEEICDQLESAESPYAVLESPLLVESGQNSICNRVLVVDIKEELQLQRASERDDSSQEEIKKILASQASREERKSHADDIIDNNGTADNLVNQVNKLHQKYLSIL